ncbi:MAG: cation diffusion facilitator family transporter [Patescibacteria group bacterium]|nr:cation diffusion facilitator family transporter [Patescibacteria group bacterium]
MSGSHEVPTNLDNKLKLGLIFNTGFTIFEFGIGIISGSLALVSDATHNLTDSMSLLVSFFATKIAKREANIDKTYGYGRATVLAALINALILLGLAVYIFIEAYKRFQNPQPVEGGLVMIVAFVGILINGSIAYLFFKSRGDLNIRSAFLNMAMDALASVGALFAGLIIVLTGKTFIDPFISIIIGIMLLYSGWSVVKDALHALLEGTPEGTDVTKIKQAICAMPGVTGLDDLHVWALSTTSVALSCHLIIKDSTLKESMEIKERIKEMLSEKFHTEHATIETELTEGPHHDERTDEGM